MLSCPTQGQAQTLQTLGSSLEQKKRKRGGNLRCGQQWEGLTVSLMWKCSRACTLGYSHTACKETDNERKGVVGKKCILKSWMCCFALYFLKSNVVTATLPVSQDKAVRNCPPFSTMKGLWSWHAAYINWQGGIWSLVKKILISP